MRKQDLIIVLLATSHLLGLVNSESCSDLILDMANCISYIIKGSTESNPNPSCCSGLKTVLRVNPTCVCEALENSDQLGIDIVMSRALSLPSACRFNNAPSLISQCGVSNIAPTHSILAPVPVLSPISISPAPQDSIAPTPTTLGPVIVPSPSSISPAPQVYPPLSEGRLAPQNGYEPKEPVVVQPATPPAAVPTTPTPASQPSTATVVGGTPPAQAPSTTNESPSPAPGHTSASSSLFVASYVITAMLASSTFIHFLA